MAGFVPAGFTLAIPQRRATVLVTGRGLAEWTIPPNFYAVRSSDPTRVLSPRQLPTDHDCAVPTRGYQTDQPSHLPLFLSPALSPSIKSKTQPGSTRGLDKVAPYQKF